MSSIKKNVSTILLASLLSAVSISAAWASTPITSAVKYVDDNASKYPVAPFIAKGPNNTSIVAWTSYAAGATNGNIRVRILDANGVPKGASILVSPKVWPSVGVADPSLPPSYIVGGVEPFWCCKQ